VYVMPEHNLDTGTSSAELDIAELIKVLWQSKWRIAGITSFCTALALSYALLATPWYQAEVLLAPVEERAESALANQFGSIASIAGINVGNNGLIASAIATLESRELAGEFIEDHQLLTVFFADDWDADQKRWKEEDPEDWPDVRNAVKFFQEEMLTVTQDRQTSMVTLSLTWTDADQAAEWANELAVRVNARMRKRALKEAETNVAYLGEELAKTTVVTMQQSISRLLETEMQKLMLARGSEEYAFRVIDVAQAPRKPDRPRRLLITALGMMVGGMLALIWVLVTQQAKRSA
jgi:uncharacterized protein involved in exopolysaccharide biosynthesis